MPYIWLILTVYLGMSDNFFGLVILNMLFVVLSVPWLSFLRFLKYCSTVEFRLFEVAVSLYALKTNQSTVK